MKKSFLYLFITLITVLFFTSCASKVKSTISVFHELNNNGIKTYSFVNKKEYEYSLEYKTYENKLKNRLFAKDFVYYQHNADILIAFEYGVDTGKSVLSSNEIYGKIGYDILNTRVEKITKGDKETYTVNETKIPQYGYLGTQYSTSVQYRRFIIINMYDNKSKKKIYEAKIYSLGNEPIILSVIDEMLDSLFFNFPGEYAKTYEIEVPYIK